MNLLVWDGSSQENNVWYGERCCYREISSQREGCQAWQIVFMYTDKTRTSRGTVGDLWLAGSQ